MHEYLPFIVAGLTAGGVFALAALGLVLTYRTSGMFNFAHGGVGMFSTYMFYSLRQHLPTPVAIVLAVFVVAPLLGVIIDRLLLRRLEGAGPVTFVVASVGLLVALQSIVVLIYGNETLLVQPFFPSRTLGVFGTQVGIDQAFIVGLALASALGLVAFFRWTQLGLQTRAVVSDRALTSMTGVNASAVTSFSWVLGSAFAAASGIVFAPSLGLNAVRLTLLVVASFGAAALGRLVSFPVAVAGAFGIGILQALATKFVSESGSTTLIGLPGAVPFIVLLIPILFYRRGSLQELTATRPPRAQDRRASAGFPYRLLVLFVGVAAALPPFLAGYRIVTLTATVAMVLLFISLSLLAGLSRQVSLAHSLFVIFGATTLGHFLEAGVPYLLALPLAALVFVPVGALIAFPAIRLSGLYLALGTFGFAALSQDLLFNTSLAFGEKNTLAIPRPALLAGDSAFFYFALAVVTAGVVAVEVVRVSRLGRVLTALADSPKAVQSIGIQPLVARVLTFSLSAFLAALAGGLLGSLVESFGQETYNPYHSLLWLAVLVTTGAATLGGSILAAVLLVGLPSVVDAKFAGPDYLALYLGLGAIFLAQVPNGLAGLLRRSPLRSARQRIRRMPASNPRSLERYVHARGGEHLLSEGVER